MTILIDENTTFLVQGITGRTGAFATRYSVGYGTKIIAGVTPGRGGEKVLDIPVYNAVEEALEIHGAIDASITFVPAPTLKNAVLEALEAGVKKIIMPVERVPLHDVLYFIAKAKREKAILLGPGSMGLISPGRAVAGWVGGAEEVTKVAFKPGRVGVISRSGGQTTTVCWNICRAGLGISTAVHTGTEPVLGLTAAEMLQLFEQDDETDVVAMFGEIGGVMEEEVAELIMEGGYTKPLVIYIAGRALPAGIRFSHASAIIEGGRGTVESKIKVLRKADANIVDDPGHIGPTVKRILRG
jgi:succinyl-CoA synthetase alpha subunit